MSEPADPFKLEAAGRAAYAVFCRHYKRLYGSELCPYDLLASQSKEVWNATAADIVTVKANA